MYARCDKIKVLFSSLAVFWYCVSHFKSYMFGLYIHIPFCARRCPYCDFSIHVGAREKFVDEYVSALKAELRTALKNSSQKGRRLSSIFFGGGTPTFLRTSALVAILQLVFDSHDIENGIEVTIEGNPEDLTPEKLSALRKAGFNRLSLGVQSLDDEALKYLGRVHRSADVEAGVVLAREMGWENISLDLIYAVPQQSRAAWNTTLQRASQLPITHISCYSLTIESTTPFGKRAQQGTLLPVHDDDQADQMQDAQEVLEGTAFSRYEISNYARPGWESLHNQIYWRGGNYLAAGCGAHGHENGLRWWNERDSQKYVALMQSQGHARADEEQLTARQRFDELVMLGLRTQAGISLAAISEQLGLNAESTLGAALPELLAQNWLEQSSGRLRLSKQGFPLADAITAKLLA